MIIKNIRIYPRAKSQTTPFGQAGASTISRKTFTTQQKDELKRQIADRLSKKFGIDLTEFIHGKVGAFINNNQNITVEGLQQLENEIKQAQNNTQAVQKQDDTYSQKKGPAIYDEDDAKSGMSKMSGASNFDKVDQITRKTDRKDGDDTHSKYKNQKLTSLQTKKVENNLGFLNEENQWAAIYKYNKFLYDKEGDILKQREQERKRKVKEELDMQVNEKQSRKTMTKVEEEAYFINQVLQGERFDQKEKERQEEARKLKMIEKQGRDQQIKENKKAKRVETKQEKQLDSYMMQKVKEELDDENRFSQFKKEHQYQVMQKLLAENEERKRKQLQEQEKERLENVQLMDAYCRLLDHQEQERTKAIKDRDQKIKTYQEKAIELQEQELECNYIFSINSKEKVGFMERRAQKYEVRKEKKIQVYSFHILYQQKELEQQKIEKNWNQKLETREFLQKQINERDLKKLEEKFKDQEQATVWNTDNKNYFDWEKNKEEQRKKVYREYQETLRDQMKQKQDHKRSVIDQMNQHESMLNKKTLQNIDSMRQTG